ncbi:MAG: flavodoxin [Acidimicrobiales bacterium]|nr:flavodoxin [Acidimicrobiales bacterium]
MPSLLVVHHSPTAGLVRLLDAVLDGTRTDGIEGVEVLIQDALTPDVDSVASADGYLLGTPANLGYMSGALKHWFDVIYNPSLTVTAHRPYGCWVHGESDTTGAVSAIGKVTTGLEWRLARPPLSLVGAIDDTMIASAWELGASVAAGLMPA